MKRCCSKDSSEQVIYTFLLSATQRGQVRPSDLAPGEVSGGNERRPPAGGHVQVKADKMWKEMGKADRVRRDRKWEIKAWGVGGRGCLGCGSHGRNPNKNISHQRLPSFPDLLLHSQTLRIIFFSPQALAALLPLTTVHLTLDPPPLLIPPLRPTTVLIMQPSSALAPLLLVLFSLPRLPALLRSQSHLAYLRVNQPGAGRTETPRRSAGGGGGRRG